MLLTKITKHHHFRLREDPPLGKPWVHSHTPVVKGLWESKAKHVLPRTFSGHLYRFSFAFCRDLLTFKAYHKGRKPIDGWKGSVRNWTWDLLVWCQFKTCAQPNGLNCVRLHYGSTFQGTLEAVEKNRSLCQTFGELLRPNISLGKAENPRQVDLDFRHFWKAMSQN